MKHLNYILIFIFSLIINSCNESNQIKHLSGYWEINSVTLNGKEVKNFPFSNTVDYFILNQNNSGFRKKVKPRIDGGFDINLDFLTIFLESVLLPLIFQPIRLFKIKL